MKAVTFYADFHHSNKWIGLILGAKDCIENEFVRLRNLAIERLNPMYATWNDEFFKLGIEVSETDRLKDFGGTEYCKFISSRTQKILDDVNKQYGGLVKLCCDEIGDIYAIFVNRKGKTIDEFHLTLREMK